MKIPYCGVNFAGNSLLVLRHCKDYNISQATVETSKAIASQYVALSHLEVWYILTVALLNLIASVSLQDSMARFSSDKKSGRAKPRPQTPFSYNRPTLSAGSRLMKADFKEDDFLNSEVMGHVKNSTLLIPALVLVPSISGVWEMYHKGSCVYILSMRHE